MYQSTWADLHKPFDLFDVSDKPQLPISKGNDDKFKRIYTLFYRKNIIQVICIEEICAYVKI